MLEKVSVDLGRDVRLQTEETGPFWAAKTVARGLLRLTVGSNSPFAKDFDRPSGDPDHPCNRCFANGGLGGTKMLRVNEQNVYVVCRGRKGRKGSSARIEYEASKANPEDVANAIQSNTRLVACV